MKTFLTKAKRLAGLSKKDLQMLGKLNPWVADRGVMVMDIPEELRNKLHTLNEQRKEKELRRLREQIPGLVEASLKAREKKKAMRRKYAAAIARAKEK